MYTLTDSVVGVEVMPEYDLKCVCKKIETQHRTTAGRKFVYKWGEYYAATMSVRWVALEDRDQINRWWTENTPLMWFLTDSVTNTNVQSVLLVNKETPVGKFEAPYIDQFKGKLQLESY
jgi:hypothetical protein